MSGNKVRRDDLILGGVALLLLIDLLELAWYEKGGGTVSGITLPPVSNPATGSPASIFGLLAVLATLALLLDLVFLWLSPDTRIPAVGNNRSFTRWILAIVAAVLLALKFVLNLNLIGNLGVGFWLAVPLTAALVIFATQARRDEAETERAEREKAIRERERQAAKKEEEQEEEEEGEGRASEPQADSEHDDEERSQADGHQPSERGSERQPATAGEQSETAESWGQPTS